MKNQWLLCIVSFCLVSLVTSVKCLAQEGAISQKGDLEISGAINFEVFKQNLMSQQEKKILTHKECYLKFLNRYLNETETKYLNVGDYKVWTTKYQLAVSEFKKKIVPVEDSYVESDGHFLFLDIPNSLNSTVAFNIPDATVKVYNKGKIARSGDFQNIFHGAYQDIFVIYSNEISDVRDAVKLAYKLASNSPVMRGREIKEDESKVRTNFEEFLKGNYFLNHLSDEHQDFRNEKRANIQNYKYRYFIFIDSNVHHGNDLKVLRDVEFFIRYETSSSRS